MRIENTDSKRSGECSGTFERDNTGESDSDKNCRKSLVMTRINPPKSVIDRQARLVGERNLVKRR